MYRIGEAAAALGLKSYVLRFWETEFPQLEPVRTEKGQRLYTEDHIELLKLIKHLLHERGLTIDGARRILNSPDSQKILQDDNGPMIASEFSSELILGRDFTDEEYEDDEPEDAFDPHLDSLLGEVIEELEDIRQLLAPLGYGDEGVFTDNLEPGEPVVIHESGGSESFAHVTAGYWPEEGEDAALESAHQEPVSQDIASEEVLGHAQESSFGGSVARQQELPPGSEPETGKEKLSLFAKELEPAEVASAKAFCADLEDYPEEEGDFGDSAESDADAPIFNFLRNFEHNPE